jgi:spermidine synthase
MAALVTEEAKNLEALRFSNREEGITVTSGFLFKEDITDSIRLELDLISISVNTKSEFQKIQIIESVPFGKTLVLDHHTQSTQFDEFIYHESLVQFPMQAVGWALGKPDHKAKRAFIGGGGELATARELLKHSSLEEVVMVDLDSKVVDVSKKYLPEWNAGSTEDPRLKLHFTDAHAWMNRDDEATGTFDIIIMDICDPIEAGPGIVLYTQEFYQLAKTKLRPGGVLVTQSGCAGMVNHTECFTTIHNTLGTVFEHVVPYISEVPSFGSCWGFVLAFDASKVSESTLSAADCAAAGKSFVEMNAADLDARLAERVPEGKLRFYDGVTHRGLTGLNKQLRKALRDETRVITVSNPVFMH